MCLSYKERNRDRLGIEGMFHSRLDAHHLARIMRTKPSAAQGVKKLFLSVEWVQRHELKMSASLQITKRSILRLGLKKFSRSFVLVHIWDRRSSSKAHARA